MRRSAIILGLALFGLIGGTRAFAHTRVFVGVGVGPVWGPAYVVPPPVYYYPPPPAIYPAPVYYVPPPTPVYAPPPVAQPAPPPAQTGYCREYHGDATIDGKSQPFFGTACLQPDGKWHIVN